MQIWEQTQLPLGKKTSVLGGTNVLVLTNNPLVANIKPAIGISECVFVEGREWRALLSLEIQIWGN